MAYVIRPDWFPVWPAEHIIVLDILCPKQLSISFLLFLDGFKQIFHVRKQRKCAVAALSLGPGLLHDLRNLNHRILDRQSVEIEIDAIPFKTKNFAFSQSIHDSRFDDRIQRFVFRNA